MDEPAVTIGVLTCTARLGHSIDLDRVYEAADVSDPAGILALRSPDASQCRPDGSLPLGKKFGRQLTALVHVPGRQGSRCNVKVFSNGTLQITGSRSESEAYRAASKVSVALGFQDPPLDVRVRMINAHMRAPIVGRTRLVNSIAKDRLGIPARFDPSVHSAAKIVLCFDTSSPPLVALHSGVCECVPTCAFAPSKTRRCFRCVALVHQTGTVTLSGACCEVHVRRAGEVVLDLVRTYGRSPKCIT
jgi:hypothetical protein